MIYVLEFKPSGIIGRIISWFTKSKYCHTEIFIDNINYKLDWKYIKEKYKSVKDFLKKNKYADAYKIPKKLYDFTDKEIEKIKDWWEYRIDSKAQYGFFNLFSFIWKIPHKKYCKKRGIPYEMKDLDKNNVCSIAVDKSILAGGYDIFPDFPERTSYPGLFANKLKKYKVKT